MKARHAVIVAFAAAVTLTSVAAGGAGVQAISESGTGSAKPRPAGPPDTYIASWDATGVRAFSAAGLTPAEGHVIFAYVAIAVYDSVMAIEGGYEPFAVDLDSPAGASAEAAVAAAAHRVLVHYLPVQAPTILDPAYATSLATIPDGVAKTSGVAVGEEVADLLIAQRADDGFRAATPPYTPPDPPIPGVWIPTGPVPIGPYLGLMRPFALDSADQFRPLGPPALSSKRWTDDYNEVKQIGSSTSTTRTAEQTVAARFWGEAPVQQARGSFRKFVLDRDLDLVEAARFMGMISVTYADALIACFDAKYHYLFWRPITAIRAGETDGNEDTVGDPTWSTLLPGTPNHPEYPSAHSCITPAGGAGHRPIPPDAAHRLHGSQPHGARRPVLRDAEGPRVRREERPHLGRHPLPLGRRGRSRDRPEDRASRPRALLPQVAGLVEPPATSRRPAQAGLLRLSRLA